MLTLPLTRLTRIFRILMWIAALMQGHLVQARCALTATVIAIAIFVSPAETLPCLIHFGCHVHLSHQQDSIGNLETITSSARPYAYIYSKMPLKTDLADMKHSLHQADLAEASKVSQSCLLSQQSFWPAWGKSQCSAIANSYNCSAIDLASHPMKLRLRNALLYKALSTLTDHIVRWLSVLLFC